MTSLFDDDEPAAPGPGAPPAPLAERMRPRTLDEIVGQAHLLAPGRPLREAIDADVLQSIVLWGPPGTGKTTLARVIADTTRAHFIAYSAVTAGIKEIKAVMAEAEEARRRLGRRTILFVDEIHRFNKAQQDAFLPRVEAGDLVLIGATTENPSFEVNAALLSRSKVFVLQPLDEAAIVDHPARGPGRDADRGPRPRRRSGSPTTAAGAVARYASGDARVALNALELVAGYARRRQVARVDAALVADLLEKRALLYDKSGEEHFNLISALHKSLRNSDPDAALYWLARMLEAGEDPLYVARRLIRFASEDVGLADPQALALTVAAADAAHQLGMPEANTALAQAAVYLATAPKSNAVYRAYGGRRGRGHAGRRRAGPPPPPERADPADEDAGLRRRVSLRPRRAGGGGGHGLPAAAAGWPQVLRADRPWLRAHDSRTTGQMGGPQARLAVPIRRPKGAEGS